LAINQNCRMKTSYYYTRQFLNLFGLMSNCGTSLQFKYRNIKNSKTDTLELWSMHHGILLMTYYIMINVLCDEIRNHNQRYADRIEEHTTNFMRNAKSCKRRLAQDPCNFIVKPDCNSIGHILGIRFSKLSHT